MKMKPSVNTCAGKPIKAAVNTYSSYLISGYNLYAEMASKSKTNDETLIHNSACILFATSSIEAKLNELISISSICYFDNPESFWHKIKKQIKELSIEKKWNIVALNNKSTIWDNSKEPFQSYNLITSLRNELVHFKGELLPKDKSPTKKIKGLMNLLKIKSSASFIEDDCSTWCSDLFQNKKLGKWVAEKTNSFESQINKLLIQSSKTA